jgi:exonuclease III
LDGEQGHDSEGRVIVARFPGGLTVLSTYAPNNGVDDVSFERRRRWDASIADFLLRHKEEELLWMGDLNCASGDADVTGPAEWWLKQCNQVGIHA